MPISSESGLYHPGEDEIKESTQPEATEEPEPINDFLNLESLCDFVNDLAEKKSPEVRRWMNQEIARIFSAKNGKIDPNALKEAYEFVERIPDLKVVQDEALNHLAEMDIVSYSPDSEDEIIVRVDLLKDTMDSQTIRRLGRIWNSEFYGNQQIPLTLYYIFKDLIVVSEQDFLSGENEGKSLFYSPKDQSEAFDIEGIKKADFYLGLWEVISNIKSDATYPSTEDELNFSEVAIACRIYHPNYGRGYRDERGKLKVYDKESESYRQPSFDRIFRGNLGLTRESQGSPATYLRNGNLPNLSRYKLLLPDDFEVRSTLDQEYIGRTVGDKNGDVMIDNIRYYIGKSAEFKKAEIYKISDDIAVVTFDSQIRYIFSLKKQGDPDLQIQSKHRDTIYFRTSKSATNLTEFNQDAFYQQKEEESDEEYEKRISAIENFELWQKIKEIFKDHGGLSIIRSMEFEAGQARSLIKMIDGLAPEEVEEVVRSYQLTVTSIRNAGNFIKTDLKNREADRDNLAKKIVRKMMKKALDIMLQCSTKADLSADYLAEELKTLRSEVNLFTSTYKSLKDEGQNISIEDFAKCQFEVCTGNEISAEDQEKMEKTIIENRLGRSDIINQAVSEFRKALENPNCKFYILRYEGELVGFFRIESDGDLDAYLGSLNLSTEIQGSGIGDEIIRRYFIEALAGKIGHATADPRNPITTKYIGKYKFVGQAIENFGDTEIPYIKLLLNPHLNSRLKFIDSSDEEIDSLFSNNESRTDDRIIALRFPETKTGELTLKAKDILSSGEYVMSVYRIININNEKFIYAVFERIREKIKDDNIAA